MIKILTKDLLKLFKASEKIKFSKRDSDNYNIFTAKNGKFSLYAQTKECFYHGDWTEKDNFEINLKLVTARENWNFMSGRTSHKTIHPVYDWLQLINKEYKDSILIIQVKTGEIFYNVIDINKTVCGRIDPYIGKYLEIEVENQNMIGKFYCK